MAFLSSVKRTTWKCLLPVLLVTGLAISSTTPFAEENINPALWKLSDGDSEIWLLGTVHALDKGLKWRTDKINTAFASADSFYSEAPIASATPQSMAPLMNKYGFNHSGISFVEELSPEGRDYLSQVLNSLGMPESAMANFAALRPWLAAVTLVTLQMQSEGIDPESGVDKVLWEEANANGKKLGYFETLDQQFSIFGNLSHEEDLEFFEASMQQMVEDSDMLDLLLSHWKKGEIDDLANLMNASFGEDEKMKAVLLTERNQNWAYQIHKMMKGSGKIFIAVGAGHLGGEQSVQHYLKQLGYEAVRQ